MALCHSDRHLDSHGHRHGPWRDELHVGSVVTIQNPLQDTHLGGSIRASAAFLAQDIVGLCVCCVGQNFRQRSPSSFASAVSELPPAFFRLRFVLLPGRGSGGDVVLPGLPVVDHVVDASPVGELSLIHI